MDKFEETDHEMNRPVSWFALAAGSGWVEGGGSQACTKLILVQSSLVAGCVGP